MCVCVCVCVCVRAPARVCVCTCVLVYYCIIFDNYVCCCIMILAFCADVSVSAVTCSVLCCFLFSCTLLPWASSFSFVSGLLDIVSCTIAITCEAPWATGKTLYKFQNDYYCYKRFLTSMSAGQRNVRTNRYATSSSSSSWIIQSWYHYDEHVDRLIDR